MTPTDPAAPLAGDTSRPGAGQAQPRAGARFQPAGSPWKKPWLAAAAAVAGGLAAAAVLRSARGQKQAGRGPQPLAYERVGPTDHLRPPAPARPRRPIKPARQVRPGRKKPRVVRSVQRRVARMMMAAVKVLLHGVLLATVVPKAVKRRRGDARASLATAHHPAQHRVGGGRPRRWQRREAMQGRSWWGLIKETYHVWLADKAPRLGAALAYYTVFSLAPILVIVLAVVGLVYGEEAAQGEIHQQLAGFLGEDAAKGVEEMVAAARKPMSGTVAIVLGVGALLFGASGVFGQLKDAMNTIWEVEPKPGRGIWGTIKDRFLSFAMVLGIGFLLLVSLALSTALAALGRFAGSVIPLPEVVMHALNLAVSFGVITLLFAMIFKLLPDVDIAWSDVWVGAAATALLFTIGKYLFGLYLGQASVASSYGAAGSLIVVMLWAYYSAQILFFGAEFTQVYARAYGSRIRPVPGAQPVAAESRARQGMPIKKG